MLQRMLILAAGMLFLHDSADAVVKRRPRRAMTMKATAFAREGKVTAAGTEAHTGIVAADPALLPLGSRIRVSGSRGYDGEYLVTDTGASVKGRHIDLCLPTVAAAKRFGTRTVRVTIRKTGEGKADARNKDGAPDANRR